MLIFIFISLILSLCLQINEETFKHGIEICFLFKFFTVLHKDAFHHGRVAMSTVLIIWELPEWKFWIQLFNILFVVI